MQTGALKRENNVDMNHTISAKVCFALLCLLVTQSVRAQLFEKNHFGFHWLTTVSPAHKAENVIGNIKLGTKPSRGFQFGMSYLYNIKSDYGIKTGLFFTIRTYNFQFQLDADKYGLPYNVDDRTSGNLFYNFSIPLAFVYRKPLNARHNLGMEAGGYLRLYPPASISSGYQLQDTLNGIIPVMDFYTDVAPYKKFGAAWDFYVMPFWQYILHNRRMIQVGFHVNLSFWKHPIRADYYLIPFSAHATYGQYQYRSTNFGLDFSYVLTRVPNPKKTARKLHRNRYGEG